MLDAGVEMFEQPPNSPGTNVCDLGFFNSLKAGVRAKSHKFSHPTVRNKNLIQSEIWAAVKDVVNNYDSKKLFNTVVQRQVILEQMIEAGGRTVLRTEGHAGIRKFWGTH